MRWTLKLLPAVILIILATGIFLLTVAAIAVIHGPIDLARACATLYRRAQIRARARALVISLVNQTVRLVH
jgi:hypothetical protein